VTIDEAVLLRNERLERLQHSEKAGGYLYHAHAGLELLSQIARDNGDGRYTYAILSLIGYLVRLNQDARHHIEMAQGQQSDDIPF